MTAEPRLASFPTATSCATSLNATQRLRARIRSWKAANSQTFDEKLKELVALPVSHIATERVVSIPQDATLQEACTLLAQHKLKKVPVMHSGAIVGILSRSDVIRYAMNNALAGIEE